MQRTAKAQAAAAHLLAAHRNREPFRNLPAAIAPADAAEAYAAQEALHGMLAAELGPIAGLKIATTTKVMQALMGIDHPCGGAIFARRIHASPAVVRLADYVNLRLECEIAVRLGGDLAGAAAIGADDAAAAVSDIAPAFELIEDRNAVYRETSAWSLIADNAWNGGIVHGKWRPFDPLRGLGDVEGVLTIDGREAGRGRPDGPFESLAWLANLARDRGRPLAAGMVVITGSLVATFDPPKGAAIRFSLGSWGDVEMRAA